MEADGAHGPRPRPRSAGGRRERIGCLGLADCWVGAPVAGVRRAPGASTRPSRSSLAPSVLPGPSARRGTSRARRVRMIGAVPDDRRCIVVGAGLLGLSAAWALTRRGWRVRGPRGGRRAGPRALGLQGRRPHLPARLSRAALRRDGRPRARDRWRDLEAATGRRLLHVDRPGDAGRRGHAPCHRRRAGGRGRARRAGLGRRRRQRRFPGIAATGPCSSSPTRACWPPTSASARCARRAASSSAPASRCTSLRQSAERRHRLDRRRAAPSRRTSSSTAPARTRSGSSADRPGGGGPAVTPPGGLLRGRRRGGRRHAARLHRVGGRHDLRPAGPRRRRRTPAPTRCPTTRRARPSTASTRPTPPRSPTTTRRSWRG